VGSIISLNQNFIMMKKNIILAVTVLMVIIAVACNSSSPKNGSKDATQVELASFYYTCPMHPEIHSDKPGTCPVCGMDLVKTNSVKNDSTQVK
jgi:membrane fusion protein, copper/silver efflux system